MSLFLDFLELILFIWILRRLYVTSKALKIARQRVRVTNWFVSHFSKHVASAQMVDGRDPKSDVLVTIRFQAEAAEAMLDLDMELNGNPVEEMMFDVEKG